MWSTWTSFFIRLFIRSFADMIWYNIISDSCAPKTRYLVIVNELRSALWSLSPKAASGSIQFDSILFLFSVRSIDCDLQAKIIGKIWVSCAVGWTWNLGVTMAMSNKWETHAFWAPCVAKSEHKCWRLTGKTELSLTVWYLLLISFQSAILPFCCCLNNWISSVGSVSCLLPCYEIWHARDKIRERERARDRNEKERTRGRGEISLVLGGSFFFKRRKTRFQSNRSRSRYRIELLKPQNSTSLDTGYIHICCLSIYLSLNLSIYQFILTTTPALCLHLSLGVLEWARKNLLKSLTSGSNHSLWEIWERWRSCYSTLRYWKPAIWSVHLRWVPPSSSLFTISCKSLLISMFLQLARLKASFRHARVQLEPWLKKKLSLVWSAVSRQVTDFL